MQFIIYAHLTFLDGICCNFGHDGYFKCEVSVLKASNHFFFEKVALSFCRTAVDIL